MNLNKKTRIFLTGFTTLFLLLSFNNCSQLDGVDSESGQNALLSNAVENGEKAIFVWNKITYENNPVVVFSNRGAFDSAQQISWNLYHEDGANCVVEDSPAGTLKDWLQFNCEEPGKLDVILIIHTPRGDSGDYDVNIFETTIYLKESETRDNLGRTIPLVHTMDDLFPNGDINAPSTNIAGGGGYDPVGTGSDVDPRFLRGLQVYSERCAVCHDITGDPMANNADNARRYFRLRRDYYAELTSGNQSTRESRAIAAALRRIRIGLASDTFAMWNAAEVRELFDLQRDANHPVQMDAFTFNDGGKTIFGTRFTDIQNRTQATSNSLNGLTNPFERTRPIDPDPANDAPDDGDPNTTFDNDGIPDNDLTATQTFTYGVELGNGGQGHGLTNANNNIAGNVNVVRVQGFNDQGNLQNNQTREYPVVTDVFVEQDIDGDNEVFRIPRADFDYATYGEDLEALIIYIVETL